MFDMASGVNPASLGGAPAFAAQFNILQDFRHVENPAGSESLRQTRFPHMMVEGPIKRFPAPLVRVFREDLQRLTTVNDRPVDGLRNAAGDRHVGADA